MSRSYRKSPCSGVTTAGSEKEFKTECNRKLRHNAKQKVHMFLLDEDSAEDVCLPDHPRDLTDVWTGPKDGRIWWDRPARGYYASVFHHDYHNEEWWKKLMRK